MAKFTDALVRLGDGVTFLTIKALTALGAGTVAESMSVTLASDHANVPVTTPGGLKAVAVTFARPADTTAYAQYDLLAPSTTAGSAVVTLANAVRAAGEGFRVEKAALRCTDPLLKGKQIRMHIWRSAPTLSVGDNGVFNTGGLDVLAVSDIAGYVGYIDITFDKAGTAGAKGFGSPGDGAAAIYVDPSSGVDAFLTFEVRQSGGFTPVSAASFIATLYGVWP
jgi:hypothetical protein